MHVVMYMRTAGSDKRHGILVLIISIETAQAGPERKYFSHELPLMANAKEQLRMEIRVMAILAFCSTNSRKSGFTLKTKESY